MKDVAAYMQKRGYTIEKAFSMFNTDNDGSISLEELDQMFKAMKIPVNG